MTTSPTPALAETKPAEPRIFNFSAGPSALPETVLREAQRDLWSLDGTGIGVLEHSHRGAAFTRVIDEAIADCRAVGGISDDYEILFLQGGATLQFAMIPMSFLGGGTADYLHTGAWTKKAISEAKKIGSVNVAFDGDGCNFDHCPSDDEISWSADPAYCYYCSNNTIFGTEYHATPTAPGPLVCDASSDIFSRPLDVDRHAMIYAGAQKNLGPAGCALVIIRKDFLDRAPDGLPSMLDYKQHADKGSCLNTPPTFAIYVMGRVFKWLLDQGGLEHVKEHNRTKAKSIYDAIDGSGGFYSGVAQPESRSLMNISFKTPNADLDKKFIGEALEAGMSGLKGHRSVGGLRASTYNAVPAAACTALAEFMGEFARTNG